MNKSDFGSSKLEFNLFHRVVFLDKKLCFILSFYAHFTVFNKCSGYRRRSKGEQWESVALHVLVPINTFKDVFHNTGDIGVFRADIFCPQTTQELPKKHPEVGLPEQLPTA